MDIKETVLFLRFIVIFICFIVFIKSIHSPINVPVECTSNSTHTAEIDNIQLHSQNRYRYSPYTLRCIGRTGTRLHKPDNSVLSRLKELNILCYRRKRAGVTKSRYKHRFINNNNLVQIPLNIPFTSNRNSGNLKISTANVRSVKNKSAEVLQYIFNTQIDLCVLTETWLHQDSDDIIRSELCQKGFGFDDVPRSGRQGGGIGLLYRDNINVQRLFSIAEHSFEYVEWKIITNKFSLIIAGIYRPPYSENHRITQAQFIHEFPTVLDRLNNYREPVYLLGDLNFHLDVKQDTYTKQLNSLLKANDMQQIVTSATHSNGHILDVIISRNSDKIESTLPETDYYISDHCFVSCRINKESPPLTTKVVQYRKWRSLNEAEFVADVSMNTSNYIEHRSNTNIIVDNFNSFLTNIVDKHVPLKEKKITIRPEVPWFSNYLRKFKQWRRIIEQIHIQFKTDISALIYNKIKNRYSAAIFSAKQFYYHKIIHEAEGNTKHLYNVVSDVMGRAQENPLPPCSNDSTLANNFLDFFSSKVSKIRHELDQIPSSTSIETYKPLCEESLTKFDSLSESEVRNIVMKSKSTTCSLDIIPTQKLKSLLDHFLPYITKIINSSLETGIFPQAWKKAIVKPLIKKKGLPLEFKSYRPVSNLSFLSKVLEKAALQQVVHFVEKQSLLPSYQSAYRKNYGVETTMLKMYSDLLSAADKKMVSLVVMIDLSAAFDTVDIPILLSILKSRFNIKDIPLQWFESYLTERTMNVIINNKLSKTETLQYGVPQGSCAGPVVFTLYIAALNTIIASSFPNINLYGYADDHKLALVHFAGNTDSELQAKHSMERCLENVIVWMTEHKLKMNNSKTEIILYGTKQQLSKSNITELNVGSEIVKCVRSVRDLGVYMENTLNFDLHIRKKCQIANNQLHNIRSVRKHLSQKSTEILIHGLIHSHLDFCNGLFANIPAYQINRLQTIQNRAAKIVVNASYDQPSIPILKSLHWLPVRARIQFKTLITVFKCLKGTAPTYLSDLLTIKQYKYNARSSTFLTLTEKRTNTKMAERAFDIVGPKWWNTLPANIRRISSEAEFRRELKTHLFKTFYF